MDPRVLATDPLTPDQGGPRRCLECFHIVGDFHSRKCSKYKEYEHGITVERAKKDRDRRYRMSGLE